MADANTAFDSLQCRRTTAYCLAEIEAVIPTLAWLLGDLLIKRFDTLIAEEADDASALSIPDRQRQAAQVQSDLLAAERDLCWFVWRGLDDRLPVWFDGDISPAAIIGAQVITPLAFNGGGASPQHVFDMIGR